MDPTDFALLILRVWLGIVMLAHGINHARSLDGTAKWFAAKGFRQAKANAVASAVGEILIGTALIAGFATAFALAGLTATMIVAFGSIHRFAGFFVFQRPDEGYEYVLTLVAAAAALAILGPGAVSTDGLIGLDSALDEWVGLGIVALGAIAGAAQLAAFWRHPSPPTQDQKGVAH